jgi:hypothetical protein
MAIVLEDFPSDENFHCGHFDHLSRGRYRELISIRSRPIATLITKHFCHTVCRDKGKLAGESDASRED